MQNSMLMHTHTEQWAQRLPKQIEHCQCRGISACVACTGADMYSSVWQDQTTRLQGGKYSPLGKHTPAKRHIWP